MYTKQASPSLLHVAGQAATFNAGFRGRNEDMPSENETALPQGVTSLSSNHFCKVFWKQVLFICMQVHVYISEVHMLTRRQHISKSRWPVLSGQTIPAWQTARPWLNGINIRHSIFPEMSWEIVCFRIYQASFRLDPWSLGSTVSQDIEKSIRLL